MQVEAQATITVIMKDGTHENGLPRQKAVKRKFYGNTAKEQAEAFAKQYINKEGVEYIICKSQCVLSND